MISRRYFKATRPAFMGVKLKNAIMCNIIECPDGWGVPEEIEKTDFGNYNIYFTDGTVLPNVSLSNLDIPSEKELRLLVGGGRIKCNKMMATGEVDERWIPDWAEKDILQSKIQKLRESKAELEYENIMPSGQPAAKHRFIKDMEHAGEARRRWSTGYKHRTRTQLPHGFGRYPSPYGRSASLAEAGEFLQVGEEIPEEELLGE